MPVLMNGAQARCAIGRMTNDAWLENPAGLPATRYQMAPGPSTALRPLCRLRSAQDDRASPHALHASPQPQHILHVIKAGLLARGPLRGAQRAAREGVAAG